MTMTQDVAHAVEVWALAIAMYWTTHDNVDAAVQGGAFMAAEDEVAAATCLAVYEAVSDPIARAVIEAVHLDPPHSALDDYVNNDQILKWINERLNWTHEGAVHMRVFAVPPEWARMFYNIPLAQALAYVTPEVDGNPSVMVWVSIGSTGEHSIVFQGPWETPDKARRRLDRLLKDLNGTYIPSLEALLDAAGNSGCSVEAC